MAKDGTRGLSPEQWVEVRAAYESGESEASISRRTGADRKTIRTRRQREQWTPQVIPQVGKAEAQSIHERAQSNVIDIASRRAVDQAEACGVVDAIVSEIVITRRLALKMARAYEAFADAIIDGSAKPSAMPATRDMAQFMKDALGGYKLLLSTIREDIGRRPGEATASNDEQSGVAAKVEFEVVYGPTGTDGA